MKKHVFIVIAVVVVFLGLIVAYTMTPPAASSASGANGGSMPAAKH